MKTLVHTSALACRLSLLGQSLALAVLFLVGLAPASLGKAGWANKVHHAWARGDNGASAFPRRLWRHRQRQCFFCLLLMIRVRAEKRRHVAYALLPRG